MSAVMERPLHHAQHSQPLGVIAGSGNLPLELLRSCQAQGRDAFVVAFDEQTDPQISGFYPHIWISPGDIGKAIDALRSAGVKELVLAGKINRPRLSSLQPDMATAKLLSRLGAALFGGDNVLFSSIVRFLEDEGFSVIGADDVLGSIIATTGPIGKTLPSKQAQRDIEIGVKLAHLIGSMDVGQAVIVKNGLVLGVEAAEGTDALINRCAALAGEGIGGVLVKAKKPLQERRVDLPAIGAQTIDNLHRAGFLGVAVEAGGSIIIDREKVAARADAMGIFIVGFSCEDL